MYIYINCLLPSLLIILKIALLVKHKLKTLYWGHNLCTIPAREQEANNALRSVRYSAVVEHAFQTGCKIDLKCKDISIRFKRN